MHYNESIKYLPALSKRKRPDWFSDYGIIGVPNTGSLGEVLAELYEALNNDLFMLAGTGVRTAFDMASELLGIDASKTFSDKLQELVIKNHIHQADKDRLNILIEAGNASAHRGWKPSAQELKTLMDVLENFIYHAFVLFLKGDNGQSQRYQLFIEPKGEHLREKNKWKEDFLLEIKARGNVQQINSSKEYILHGLPFYNYSEQSKFSEELDKVISA